MEIRFTSVVYEGVAALVRAATLPIQLELNEFLNGCSYGAHVNQFVMVVVSVGNSTDNEPFVKTHNKSGTYKHPISSEKIKFISIALPYHPDDIQGKTLNELKTLFAKSLRLKLEAPDVSIPKGFNYKQFKSDLNQILEKLDPPIH